MNLNSSQYTTIRDAVYGYVTGCPEPALISAIGMAVHDYVRDIGGILADDDISTVGNTFAVIAPYGGAVNHVRAVSLDGNPLPKDSYLMRITEDGVAVITLMGPCCIRVSGKPHTIGVKYTWMPTTNTSEMPVNWFSQHEEGIRNGTLVALLSQLKNPWGDQAMLAKFTADYGANVHDALMALHQSDNRGGQLNAFDSTNDWTCGGF